MSFLEDIQVSIGKDIYSQLNNVANSLFSKKKQISPDCQSIQRYFTEKLLPELTIECELFESKNIKISPLDIVNILYKCKLLKSCSTYEEYREKTVGYNLVDEFNFFIPWENRDKSEISLIETYFERLKSNLKTNTLIVEINSFNGADYEIQCFFDNLFERLNYPFTGFIESDKLSEEYKTHTMILEAQLDNVKNYFSAPSIGFSIYGSTFYCRWYSNIWLKSFLSLLKIGGFVFPGQVEFGHNIASIQAPIYPVFLGSASKGCFIWDQDRVIPLIKIPDGCLSRSFGNRSITKMWLDIRTFNGIRGFIIENKPILDQLRNPWKRHNLDDVTPTLDILSSATQSTDIGAKILMIYCCLEHLFVPHSVRTGNKSYIVGGIYSLDTRLIEWFEELYIFRCNYAHKGYIKGDDKLLEFIKISISNTLRLLRLKLNNI